MIATIKRPSSEIRGEIPAAFLDLTRKYFGADDVEGVNEKDDELVSIVDTKWYKNRKKDHSPCRNLKNYRTVHYLTQAALAEDLGILTHHISEMENGKRAISKAMALKLSEVFDVSPDRFI
jgi:DNA-binding XRE family transcriptional regulator